jgi:isochorismate synthase
MAVREVQGAVIWRLPDQQSICFLDGSSGNDRFLVSPFNKLGDIESLKGTITEIKPQDIPSFFSGWVLPEARDRDSTRQEDYMHWVDKAREAMSSGAFDKVVLARKLWKTATIDLPGLFDRLMANYPNAFVYAFKLDNGLVMAGATPETLLRKSADVLYTEALGGTRTRNTYSEKETIEHGHISEYVGNVLKQQGYDFVRGESSTRRAGVVEHLQTPFTAPSRGFEADMSLAYALHPTAAVCGLPFTAAFDFIRHTENFDRRYYSGFLGPVNEHSDFSLFVNLRCAEIFAEGLVLYAGAGLNVLSDPKDEWDETAQKMQTIAQRI